MSDETRQDTELTCVRPLSPVFHELECGRAAKYVVKIPTNAGRKDCPICARHAVWYKKNGYSYEVVRD